MKLIFPFISIMLLLLSQSALAQSCRTSLTQTTPDADFIWLDDGTVRHLPTGMIWMRCSLGQTWTGTGCSGEARALTWTEALDISDGQTFAGRSDWKLPTRQQLTTIVEKSCTLPSINRAAFPDTMPFPYWTATPFANDSGYSWAISFELGNVQFGYYDHDRFYVRLVAQ
ncbi:DUF1566 domain-containing protein [Salinispirillum sp. LH 10-3-1]|uniref:DUF1566 domain-containing protein n=1 Tax=Salinispirillum sp. LH 10-3-1 TaxID=2952525 RepID=A0AB38YDN8_9GAMM